MFTGITEEVGYIKSLKRLTDGLEVIYGAEKIIGQLKEGDSVAVNGVCSTVTAIYEKSFKAQYLKETLQKTTFSEMSLADSVNLELSLTPTSRMGGHYVSGHVDDIGTIKEIKISEPWGVIVIEYKPEFQKYLVPKGSICIDGLSLTLVDVTSSSFSCHIIPHTLKKTTLSTKKKGDRVNLEYDILGKYLYNFFSLSNNGEKKNDVNLKKSLFEAGFINGK
jgi:riboflavin synthase